MITFTTENSRETYQLGQALAQSFAGGEVLALLGDLGAGKTCLTQGIAQGLGIKQKINSPTFVIMKVYNIKGRAGIKKFCHIDAYRLNSHQDLVAIGALDYLNRADTVTVIEWAEKVKKIWPQGTRIIKIEHRKKDSRKITLKKIK